MGKIIPIKYLEEILSGEEEKTVFYPRTHLRAVIDSNGRTLEDILKELLNTSTPITLDVSLSSNKSIFDENEEKKGTLNINVLIKRGSETLPLTEVESIRLSVETTAGLILDTNTPELNESGTGYKPINFSFNDSSEQGYSSSTITLKVILKSGISDSDSINILEIARSYVGFIYMHDLNDNSTTKQDIKRAIDYFLDDDKLDNDTGDKIIPTSQKYPNIISTQKTTLAGINKKFNNIRGDGSNNQGYCFFILVPKDSHFKKDLNVYVSGFPWTSKIRTDLDLLINGVRYEVRHSFNGTNLGSGSFDVSI